MKAKIRNIDFSTSFAAALCIGTDINSYYPSPYSYTDAVMAKLAFFDQIHDLFKKKKLAYEYDRNAEAIILIGIFPLDDRDCFAEKYILPRLSALEEQDHKIVCGIGLPAMNNLHMPESVSTSKEAFELHFFETDTFFEYQKSFRRNPFSFEDYEKYSERALKSILMKSADALENIDACMDLIRTIHYGNKNAAIMRAMNFTGELAYQLHRYHFLESDFYKYQDALQEKVLSATSYANVKTHVLNYYREILPIIYREHRGSGKMMVEQVKAYIRENYMKELSVEELAAIACVSPTYFSHMFKNETGENYKSYLTGIRLDAAMELLSGSDLRLYEISELVGYKNVRTFVEAFQRKYGVTPGIYKKQL